MADRWTAAQAGNDADTAAETPAAAPIEVRPLDDQGREALTVAAEGLNLLIRLLDREADAELIEGLKESEAGSFFAEVLPVGAGHEAGEALQSALDTLPLRPDAATLDLLAADFADCFLTHGYRLSPSGSVWMSEERLERQEPMFAVREWYDHYGLAAPDWRKRADDHMVHELQFVAHLLTLGEAVAALDAARFLDQHVLPWVPEYGRQMQARCATPLLAAVGGVLATYPLVVRDLLAELTGVAPQIAARPGDKPHPKAAPDQVMYIPGAEASW